MNNVKRVMAQSNVYIDNINRLLKDIKLEISTNFICPNNKRIVVTANKIAVFLDLNIVEKYIKKLNDIDSSNIMSPRLP